jgi:hypothetical protein
MVSFAYFAFSTAFSLLSPLLLAFRQIVHILCQNLPQS